MKRRVSFSILCFVLTAIVVWWPVDATTRQRKARVICNYAPAGNVAPRAMRFGSVFEAEAAVDRILKVAGLTRNFVIESSYDVDNAESGLDGNNRRYIYYNPEFMDHITNKARTDWAALGIMAHEIGHHLLGHRTDDEGRTPQEEQEMRHRKELEADKYSGFILRYMGASAAEAQSAVEAYGSEIGSPTHPRRNARLEAIRAGWDEASSVIKGWVTAEERRGARLPPPQSSPLRQNSSRTAPGVSQIRANNTSAQLSQDRWAWTVFIDAPQNVLDQVNCVVYQLHPTFRPSVVQVCERGAGQAFAFRGQGWGSFNIQIRVLMKDRRQYDLSHALRF